MSTEPTQTCELCGRTQVVVQNGPGFPPDAAKRKLAKACKANGCLSQPKYMAGIHPDLMQKLRDSLRAPS